MAERMGFQGKLREVLGFAREREDHLLAEDVEKFFEEEGLPRSRWNWSFSI